MAGDNDTQQRILKAALTTLTRAGAHRLSVSEVSALAGISRGTLYHYFGGRDGLLRAVGAHVADIFKDALVADVQARPDPKVRLQVVLESLVNVGRRHPEAVQLLALEPGFGMELLRRVFPDFVDILQQLLVPAAEGPHAVEGLELTRTELADLVVRIVMLSYLIPAESPAAAEASSSGLMERLLMVASANP